MSETIKIRVQTILGIKRVIGQREFELSLPAGSTVKDLLSLMVSRWGDDLSAQLFQAGGNSLIPHVRLMVNGRSIEFLKGMNTELRDGDEFLMLPMAAGG